MIKDEVRCLLSLSLLFGRLTRRHSETTWTQHRDLASASELLQQRWDRTVLVLCPLHSSVFLLSKDLAQVQQSEKKNPSRITKPNCKSDLSGYPKILAYKREWKHSPAEFKVFVSLAWPRAVDTSGQQKSVGRVGFACACWAAHGFAANRGKAQLPSHGTMECKSVQGIHWPREAKPCAVCYRA